MRYLSDVLKEKYGEKVYRLTLSSGCTCPNRDGTLARGGCAFCSEGGSGEFAAALRSIDEQIDEAKALIAKKTGAKKFIAYFQAYSNTYGEPGNLEKLYLEAISRPEIVALSLGTRPDCLSDDVIGMLERLSIIKPVWVEMGLQTANEATAQRMNRCFSNECYAEAVQKLHSIGCDVVSHLIFGFPDETREDMLRSVRYIAALRPEGVKLQMLNILTGTRLAEEYAAHPWRLLTREEYADIIAEAIKLLPDETVIHRLTGDGRRDMIIAPEWVKDKKRTLNAIHRAISRDSSSPARA